MRKRISPLIIPLTKFKNPKEFQCIGFNLTNMDVLINRGYVQVNAGYVDADGSKLEHCGIFTRAIRAGPIAAFRNMTNKYGNISDYAEAAKGAFAAAQAGSKD